MLRKIVIGVVGVGVVVTGAMWAAATYFLDNATIAEQLKKETAQRFNRTLVFQGELQTKFFPKIQIVLPPTTLSFEGSDKPQFTLNGAEVGVAVLPLLKGDVQFDAVVIDGLKGQVNVSRFLKKIHERPTQEADSQTVTINESEKNNANQDSSFIKNLEVASLEIRNAALTAYGLQSQKVYAVDLLNLSTGKLGLSGTTPVKFSTRFAEKTQGLSGQVAFNSTVAYDIKTMSVSMEKPSITVSANQKEQSISAEVKANLLKYASKDVLAKGANITAKVNDVSVMGIFNSAETKQMQTWSLEGLNVNISQADTVKANINGDFAGEIEAFSLQSKKLGGNVQANLGHAVLQVPFNGQVSMTPGEKVDLKLKGKLDNSPWESEVELVGFNVPTINGYFTLDSFVADKWHKVSGQETKKVSSSTVSVISQAYAASTSNLDVLNRANGSFGIHVNTLKYQGLTVSNFDTTLSLSKGVLSFNNLLANACSGTFSGKGQINTAEKWSFDLNAKGVDTQALMQALGSEAKLYGKANATVKLAGLGLEKTALLKSANGQISVSANNAVLKGLSLEKVGNAVKAKKVTGLIMKDEDQTRFSILSASANISNGVLNIHSLDGKTSVAEVKGNVTVGLIDESLSGLITAKLATSVDGRRISVPIKLGGTIQAPSYGIDLEAALKAGVKDVIKEATKDPKKIIQGLEKLFRH
ncbi:MAG TPA: AsmA family protein [Candidatus Aphodousia faecalis]|nr:AsmA family protein [Candidatus Aphodousia faecalis]